MTGDEGDRLYDATHPRRPDSAIAGRAGRRRRAKYPGWARQGFIIRPDNQLRLKALAWYDRKEISQLMDEILTGYFTNVRMMDGIVTAYRDNLEGETD